MTRRPADPPFTRADLDRAFPPPVLRRGLDHQRKGAVAALEFDDDGRTVCAMVKTGNCRLRRFRGDGLDALLQPLS